MRILAKQILLFEDELQSAQAGQAITLILDKDVDVSRGDIIVAENNPCEVADHFQAHLVWMDYETGYVGREFIMKIGTLLLLVTLTQIKFRINIDRDEKTPAKNMELNDFSVVTIKSNKPFPYENYNTNPKLGSFVLINKYTNQTAAVGMIDFGLRRATNIHRQKLDIDKSARRQLFGHTSKVIWFTGLSGSGKSTIANALEKELHAQGIHSYILDGDNIRHGLNKDLGFSEADRVENIRRIAEVAKLFVDSGVFVLAASISPYEKDRKVARDLFEKEEFVEVFVDTPIEIAEARDPKGLYKKARAGQLPNFTGIGSPYEPPPNPEIKLSSGTRSVKELTDKILDYLNNL